MSDPQQASLFDYEGIDLTFRCRHVDLKGNLIKAMMVMNWLNMLEVENF